MTGVITDYYAERVVQHLTGVAAMPSPSPIFIGLAKADPGILGAFVDEVDAVNTSYVRQPIAMQATVSAVRSVENNVEVTFPEATEVWGTVTHWFIADAVIGGNMLFSGPILSTLDEQLSISINEGDSISFGVGQILVRFPV